MQSFPYHGAGKRLLRMLLVKYTGARALARLPEHRLLKLWASTGPSEWFLKAGGTGLPVSGLMWYYFLLISDSSGNTHNVLSNGTLTAKAQYCPIGPLLPPGLALAPRRS